MRFLSIPLVAGGLAAASLAQNPLTTKLTAQSSLTVFAGSSRHTIPSGSDVTAGASQQATLNRPAIGGAASTMNVWTDPATETWITVANNVNLEAPNTSAGVGPQDVLLTLTPLRATAADIALSYSVHSTLLPHLTTATGTVDIGNDGSIELAGSRGNPAQLSAMVPIPAGGLPIRFVTTSSVNTPALAGRSQVISGLVIRITPVSRCTVTASHPSPCVALAPNLDARMTFAGTLRLRTMWTPNRPALLLAGTQLAPVPLPGTICFMDVRPLVTLPLAMNAQGVATVELTPPAGVPALAHFQSLTFEPQGIFLLLPTGVATISCP